MPTPRSAGHPSPISRRDFVKGAAAVAGVGVLGFPAILRGGTGGASEKLRIAMIACGGRGAANLGQVTNENIVALCDVDERQLDRQGARFPQAKKFKDFRKLYDTLKDSEFDAVMVSTPEHTHAFATLPALKRKKHVYCEKPLTRDVREARLITLAAKESGVVTQMGNQNHAQENYRRVVELVQAGAIGPITEAHVWVSRAWGWQSKEEAEKNDIQEGEGANKKGIWTVERPSNEDPVPPFLDWDLWVGPAPMRPFNNIYFPGPKWYRWWDFGNGTMSDLGSHMNDMPFWALKLDAPLAISATGPAPHPEIAPASMSATYEYGPRGDMPPVKLTWHQGTSKPKQWTEGMIPQNAFRDGILFVGSKGMIVANHGSHRLLPEDKFKDFQRPPQTIAKSPGHWIEWLRACKGGAPTMDHFGYAGRLTEANHLGNVAFRAGKRLEWDTVAMKFPNAPEAERFLGRSYRKGWELA